MKSPLLQRITYKPLSVLAESSIMLTIGVCLGYLIVSNV